MAIVSIELPSDIYERLQREAEQSSRTLEEVLIEDLALLSGKSASDLTIQASFSDEKLWAIVHHELGENRLKQMRELIEHGQEHSLSPEEQIMLEDLLSLENQIVLLRSQALVLLKQRGHDIQSYLNRKP